MYDGSTALTEAALMAERLTGRNRVLVARSVHPEYRQVLATYARNLGLAIEELQYTQSGQIDRAALTPEQLADAAAVIVQTPNFFGVLEEIPALAAAAHAAGALLVAAITEPVSLGIVRPPAEADIVAMEGQAFGVSPSYGGPYVGVIATREKFVRQMPGRLAGQTTDTAGRRGFVLTLATREQHIRREKATSNICTAQALNALAGVVYLTWLGRRGIVELGELLLARTHYARETLAALNGVEKLHEQPVIREFALRLDADVAAVRRRCALQGVNPGVDLEALSGRAEDRGGLLVAITERRSRADIDRLAEVLGTAVEAERGAVVAA
jgi:glycine dehydrogenase subunit 1